MLMLHLVCWKPSRRIRTLSSCSQDDDEDAPVTFKLLVWKHFEYLMQMINSDRVTNKTQTICMHCKKTSPYTLFNAQTDKLTTVLHQYWSIESGILYHWCLMYILSCSRVLGFRCCISRFVMCYKFWMGDRSGLHYYHKSHAVVTRNVAWHLLAEKDVIWMDAYVAPKPVWLSQY